jgi:TonB family protein
MDATSESPPPFSAAPPRGKETRAGFQLSLALHGAVAFLIFFKIFIFPSQPITYIPALRVDIVGLPDQLKKDLAHPAPIPATAPAHPPAATSATKKAPPPKEAATEPDDAMGMKRSAERKAEKKREKKMESALARIKALAKISGDSTPKKAPTQDAQATQIAGNKISKGTSLSNNAQQSDKENYVDTLQNALQQNWTLPIWLERQQLNAKILIYIDAQGRLIQFKFVQSSGSPQFDDAVKRTLMQSQPFPAPPAEIASSLSSHGVLVGFPL